MSDSFDVLWLNASPILKRFDKPLLDYLSGYMRIAQWEYQQTKDEASSIDQAVELLYDFRMARSPRAFSGTWDEWCDRLNLCSPISPKVRSLTLLAVAAQPANNWQAHYYFQRQLLASAVS